MMICGVDLESTGLLPATDHVTELAWVIKHVEDPRPLVMKSQFIAPSFSALSNVGEYLPDRVSRLTKIKVAHLLAGSDFDEVMHEFTDDLVLHKVTHIVCHNGENFDRPFLRTKLKQLGPGGDGYLDRLDKRQWVDTTADCVYPEDCRHTNLMYVAAYFGFVNPFPHAALFDVMTMLKVLEQFDFGSVAARAATPWIFVKADVSYDYRHLAKERRFQWETVGDRTFPKTWVKKIKETDFSLEVDAAEFKVVQLA